MSFSPLNHLTYQSLSNGLRILLKEDHARPLVSVHGWVRVGSVDEDGAQAGISHVLEHMVFKGTAHYSAAAISRWVESMGGNINAETAREYTHYHIDVPSAGAQKAVALLGELLHGATLDAVQWDLERPVILEEIKRRNDDPDSLLYDLLSQTVFQEESLSRPIIGSPETVSALTADTLNRYYRRYYTAGRSLLVVVGDFKKAAMERWIRSAFAAMPQGSALPQRPTFHAAYRPCHLESSKRLQQAYVAFGFATPPAAHPDHEVLDLLAAVFGEGRCSRLVQVLREEKKIVWSINASNMTYEGPGLFGVFAECAPARRKVLFSAFDELVRGLRRQPPTSRELRRAKNLIQNSWLQGFETYHNQASTIGLFALEDDLERLKNYLPRLLAITPSQTKAAIDRYLDPLPFSSVVIGP